MAIKLIKKSWLKYVNVGKVGWILWYSL